MKTITTWVTLLACTSAFAVGNHFEGFEDPGFAMGGNNWNSFTSTVNRVSSGTNGITSKTGGFHAEVTGPTSGNPGAFTRLGGYSSSFGQGFTTSLDIYLDLSDALIADSTAANYGFDLSSAASNQAGGHRRDFIFHTADTTSGTILVGGSNNSNNSNPRGDIASLNHYEVTNSGWYTFESEFYDFGNGTLAVDLNLRDSSGSLLWTETRNDGSDLLSSVVGGNRYMWFTFHRTSNLAIDNTSLEAVPEPATMTILALAALVAKRRKQQKS